MSDLPKFCGTSNKIIKSMIVQIQRNLQQIAKPGANRIKRVYRSGDKVVTLLQTDPHRFNIVYSDPVRMARIWLVDNQVDYIWLKNEHGTFFAEQVVGRVTPFIDEINQLLFVNTPRGKLTQKLNDVKEHLLLTAKTTSGYTTRKIELDQFTYHVTLRKSGKLDIDSFGANKELNLTMDKKDLKFEYMEWDSMGLRYNQFTEKKQCDKIIKLLDKLFPKATSEKGIRVQ